MSSASDSSLSVEELFRSCVQSQPQAEVIVQGDWTFTYLELDNLAYRIAKQLSIYNLHKEEPIGILLPMGIANIAAQLAIIRVGASCVPLNLCFPDQRIHTLYARLNTRIVITNSTSIKRFSAFKQIVLEEESLDVSELDDTFRNSVRTVRIDGTHRTHVLHTSGTTGQPKAVEIESQGVVNMARNERVVKLCRTDRVAQIAPPSFDATLQEVWASLLVGATVIVLRKAVVTDPWALQEQLIKHRVTGFIATPTLLQHIVSAIPHAFASLDWLITAGEAANPEDLLTILENGSPRKLVNAYGPTECSCTASMHEVTVEECRRRIIPIGKPTTGVTLFVLDEHKTPTKGSQVGEIYIGGKGVSRGYFQNQAANAKSFVSVIDPSCREKTARLYKTGDLGRVLSDGSIECLGRADDLVKIRGHRIDLAEIESVIHNSQLTLSATVLSIKRPGKETYLVAFTVHKYMENFFSKLESFLRRHLPTYMIPRIETVQSIPRTAHGKTDRKALINSHIQVLDMAYQGRISDIGSVPNNVSLWLKQLWCSLLDIHNVSEDSNFFDIGGSSLQASALLIRIRQQYNLTISMQQIWDTPKLKQMAMLIENGAHSNTISPTKVDVFTNDSKLADNISIPLGKVPNWQATDQGRIFLTGATGYTGAHILRDLIERSDVKEIRCLVRAENAITGRDRIVSAIHDLGATNTKCLHKIVALPGDLGKERFGFDQYEFDDLAAWASAVFHIGANVNFVQSYETLRAANVIGTLNCIKLAASRPISLYYMSTGAVTGPISYFTGAQRVMETTDISTFTEWLPYDLGYTQSKWVAERLVQTAQAKGLASIIYRPGFIMGDGVHGQVNQNDFMSRWIRGCLRIGHRPILPKQSKLMVTADWISAAFIHISLNSKNSKRVFHLVPENHDDIDLDAFWNLLTRMGYNLKATSYNEWLQILSRDDSILNSDLLPLIPLMQEPVLDGLTRWEVWNNMATIDTTQCRQALIDMTEKGESKVDVEFIERYMTAILGNDKSMLAKVHC